MSISRKFFDWKRDSWQIYENPLFDFLRLAYIWKAPTWSRLEEPDSTFFMLKLFHEAIVFEVAA